MTSGVQVLIVFLFWCVVFRIFTPVIHVNIIGTGNVAYHLAKRFETLPGIRLQQVCGRSPAALTPFVDLARKTVSLKQLKPATITILAISDDAIAQVSQDIPFENELVVHTSGSISIEALSTKNRRGVFYPAQSFSLHDKVDFAKVPICIEIEDKKDKEVLSDLALTLTENIHILDSLQRQQLHLAAVFTNNFTNHCFTVAKSICDDHRIPFSLLYPLMQKTIDKAISHTPETVQTGPAKRGDYNVIASQLDQLENEDYQVLYKTLTASIAAYYGKKL